VNNGPILICYDGSKEADAAIAVAGRLLLSRSVVVLDVAPLMIAEGWAAASSEAPFVDRLAVDNAHARATAGTELAWQVGFEAEPRVDSAIDTWRGVVEVADEIDAAAIVIGSRGLTGLRALLEGSVSRQVEAHTRRPVLVVPATA